MKTTLSSPSVLFQELKNKTNTDMKNFKELIEEQSIEILDDTKLKAIKGGLIIQDDIEGT